VVMQMDTPDVPFSRISKLFVDRDETAIEEAMSRRQQHTVTLSCGSDVARSYTLQLAVLTAASIASRCFPGAVRVVLEPGLATARLLFWPSLKQTFGEALAAVVGPNTVAADGDGSHGRALVFGNAAPTERALRVTFDGWIATAGPAASVSRLPEREYCSLAGILAPALAISELFLEFAEVNIEAGRRAVALSLWRPDLPVSDPTSLGIPVQFLPRDLWTLGLGHLGNAYLWSVATLPYVNPGEVSLFLNDFDKVEDENVETSLLLTKEKIGQYKTRACAEWLENRGFQTRIIERPFDGNFRRRADEPGLALCGFDSNPARRDLATAEFLRVVESGLGGTPDNFDIVSLHPFPNLRPAAGLWPDLPASEDTKRVKNQERLARENAAYARIGGNECGRFVLAGKSIAVPFVGAAAATLVVAETIRLLHRGPAYTDTKLALATIDGRTARSSGNYQAQDFAGLRYSDARIL
jgi:hypothetical protein